MSILSDYTKQSCIMLYFVLSYHFTSYPRVETFGLLERPMRWCSRSALSRRRPSAWPRSAWLPCSSWPKGSGTPLSVVYVCVYVYVEPKGLGTPLLVVHRIVNGYHCCYSYYDLWLLLVLFVLLLLWLVLSLLWFIRRAEPRASPDQGLCNSKPSFFLTRDGTHIWACVYIYMYIQKETFVSIYPPSVYVYIYVSIYLSIYI